MFTQTRFFNNTDLPQNVGLSCLASIHYPPARSYSHVPLETCDVVLPAGGMWIDGMDYSRLAPRPGDHRDNLAWDDGPFHITQHSGDSIDAFYANAQVEKAWDDNDADTHGRWTNLTIKPLFVAPKATLTQYGMIVNGADSEVEAVLANWDSEKQSLPKRFAEADSAADQLSSNPAGETYRFSQERMAATLEIQLPSGNTGGRLVVQSFKSTRLIQKSRKNGYLKKPFRSR
ncbi:MAG: hypothetical protein RRC34_07335 [Lentisphaeria bacterium]|nr:hypothetical protein [Lentisphaeria bacterium]